jgi:hypothetical protein
VTDSGLKVAILGKSATNGYTKVAKEPYVASRVIMSGFGQNSHFSANSLTSGFSKKPFLQNRCEDLISTLLQCQNLPASEIKCQNLLGNQIRILFCKVATI